MELFSKKTYEEKAAILEISRYLFFIVQCSNKIT